MLPKEIIDEIRDAQRSYEAKLSEIVKKIPGAENEHITSSGIHVKPLYTPADITQLDYKRDISFPGQYPYTRGAFSAGHLARSASIRQVTGIGTAEDTNKRWKYLLSNGVTALSFVKDDGLGCRADSDDERVAGMVGKCGVVLDTLYDYETLFDGIDITKYPVHMIAGTAYALASYLIIAKQRGIEYKKLRGSMSNFLRNDNECLDIIEYCSKNVPLFNCGYLDMRNVREGGCTAAEEIAFGVSIAMAGSDVLIERGLKIDDFLHRVTWFVNASPDFFEEAAKFRAMRRVWAKIFKERYHAKNDRSLLCRMHCQTYAPTLTREQPFNNIIRSTIYAMAAVMGGVQSLSVNSFDEALSIPTEFSALLSVRTQQIIDLETNISKVIDPLGGSYYVESLTDKLEEKALSIIDTIQSKGGAFKCWGWMCGRIQGAAEKAQNDIDSGDAPLVGVNIHKLSIEDDLQTKAMRILDKDPEFEGLYKYDESIVDRQVERLNKVRKERNDDQLKETMDELLGTMKAGDNMIPNLIEAVKSGMTQAEFAGLRAIAYDQPGVGPYVCAPPSLLA